jgi:hypothetical protein
MDDLTRPFLTICMIKVESGGTLTDPGPKFEHGMIWEVT